MSDTFLFVHIKISNQYCAVCCSRSIPATRVILFVSVFMGIKMLILYFKRVSSKFGQNFCVFKGPLKMHI